MMRCPSRSLACGMPGRTPRRATGCKPFSIITTEPNELTAEVHSRLPVILHDRDYDRWLDRGEREGPPVDLLRPYEAEDMTATPCNPMVGNVRNSGPEMLNSA